MEWTIEYLDEDAIVLITTSGPSDWERHKQMCEQALALGPALHAVGDLPVGTLHPVAQPDRLHAAVLVAGDFF